MLSIEKFGGYKTETEEMIERKRRLALRNKLKAEKEIYGESREAIGRIMHFHGPMDSAKTLKLRFRRGNLRPARKEYQ